MIKSKKSRRIISALSAALISAALLAACTAGVNETGQAKTTTEVNETGSVTKAPEIKTPEEAGYLNTGYNGESFKILAIGNSFSVDGMTYLYDIAKAGGARNIVLGNLYIGGCSLSTHYTNSRQNKACYEYYKNTDGRWITKKNNATMLEGILDEQWDVITLQQVSGDSGIVGTFDNALGGLISYVNKNKTNEDCQLAWHMTWAYQNGSTHSDFQKYGSSQSKMYEMISSSVKDRIMTDDSFRMVIPSGTAVQNLRLSYIGDNTTRDGYHLNELGRYTAGLTWFGALCGSRYTSLSYIPSAVELSDEEKTIVMTSVNDALGCMLKVTPSAFTEDKREQPDLENDYTKLSFTSTAGGYWNTTDSTKHSEIITSAGNSKYFIATEVFTKEDIPVGSIIVIDSGYQYRPEAWATFGAKPTTARPGNVTDNMVTVTDKWWEGYSSRAFNIAYLGNNTDVTGSSEELLGHFTVYIPKK